MARLKTIRPRLAVTSTRIICSKQEGRRSAEAEKYRPWYKLARWCAKPNGLRWRVLVRDMFTCKRCGFMSRHPQASDMVADHKHPHRGDPVLFWSEGNVECICKACHDGEKQREDRRAF
ncbi:HNH endonuclease [Sinirhodobacter populi]|uniref:HNH endonuclease n=1 Tax=Paenirhodobacter populi TaxID=2306993 RepID=A0A443IQN6_9RHOB|nr:HNH endonuclease [Sinirhodobacter populi]